jgi:16S rRNA (cytidine1402-2'-O)-methyltransferase
MMSDARVYLIPSFLDEDAIQTIPAYIVDLLKTCQVFFVENERTARRFLKKIWKEMTIDNYEWHVIDEKESQWKSKFVDLLKDGKQIGILSEAGCPGIADPGQILVATAQDLGAQVTPLVGPSSIILGLMASGLNGQQFQFLGYLPIEQQARLKKIKEIESESRKKHCTQIFIETPYRNNQLLTAILSTCQPETRLCIAVSITGRDENIQTKSIAAWKGQSPDLNKKPAIFLILAS